MTTAACRARGLELAIQLKNIDAAEARLGSVKRHLAAFFAAGGVDGAEREALEDDRDATAEAVAVLVRRDNPGMGGNVFCRWCHRKKFTSDTAEGENASPEGGGCGCPP